MWSSIEWDEGSTSTSSQPPQERQESRYDPTSILKCIGDLNDLVASDDDEIDDEALPAPGAPAATGRSCLWRSLALVAISLTILTAGVAIGALLVNSGPGATRNATLRDAGGPAAQDLQRLLEIAERVVLACDARRRDEESDAECRDLCEGNMCCVEGAWDGASCRGGDTRVCAVYAGCEALLESTWPRH